MDRKTLAVADIFCGAGGLSTGFTNANARWEGAEGENFDVAFATDRDRQAIRTFRANHFSNVPLDREDPRAFCGDVSIVDSEMVLSAARSIGRIDALIGGPSCQGVSPAGLRNPSDKRNLMLLSFARLVQELQPLWFVMENVPGLTHSNNRELLASILKLFEEMAGYEVAADVLLAADHGVPQFRYRLFIIGTRTGSPIRFPVCSDAASEGRYPTVHSAISELAGIKPIEYDKCDLPTIAPGGLKNHWCRRIGEIDRRRIAPVRRGHDWRDIPIELLPERYFMTRSSDQKGSYGRLSWDWPAYTVTNAALNVSAGAFTHPDHDRCLSVREVARIQSFEDYYEFHGSVESQYRQVGNAVPPELAKAVAEGILYSHFKANEAKAWGRPGRLTYELVAKSLKGEATFPVLTPRRVNPTAARSSRRKTSERPVPESDGTKTASVWLLKKRPDDPWPEDTRRLRRLAEQPKNIRAAKRAQAIVHFIDGMPHTEIIANAHVSETSVQKWIDGYFAGGLNGWRAFHSSLQRLGGDDPKLQGAIARKIERVRKILLSPRKEADGAESPKRLHMNAYLRDLIGAFGKLSVDELITTVEAALGTSIGTVYVGDLLAISDAVLPGSESPRGERHLMKPPAEATDADGTVIPDDEANEDISANEESIHEELLCLAAPSFKSGD